MEISEKDEHLKIIRTESPYGAYTEKSFKKLCHNASVFEDWYEICRSLEPNSPLYPFVIRGMFSSAKSFENWHTLLCFTPIQKWHTRETILKEMRERAITFNDWQALAICAPVDSDIKRIALEKLTKFTTMT